MAGDRLAYATQRHAVPWWSFTKTVIAAAVLALARDGELVLDVPFAGRDVTLRQTLAHRAGIACYSGLVAYRSAVDGGHLPWSEDELLRRTEADRALHAPGSPGSPPGSSRWRSPPAAARTARRTPAPGRRRS